MAFTKSRKETDVYEIGFTKRLVEGETLTFQDIQVNLATVYEWVEVTDDILEGVPSVSGPDVQFTLKKAADADAQPEGLYQIRVTVTTSNNKELVGTVDLYITE